MTSHLDPPPAAPPARPSAPPVSVADAAWLEAMWLSQSRPAQPLPAPGIAWWYRLSAPPNVPVSASLAARERVRRGRLAALILLGLVVVVILSLPELLLGPALRPGIVIVVLGCLAAIPLNRMGYGRTAGVLLVMTVDLALVGTLLTVAGGLDPLYLPAFYLLVTTELIAVSLLPPASVFLVALAHSLFIAFDVQLQVHTMIWDQMMTTPGIFYTLIAGPIALQLIVAVVAYLWVHSAELALRRADRAEEIALWEHRDAERTRELEEGVQQLLAVHVHLANGDFTTRAPAVRNHALWQVGASLNNLIARLARSAQTAEQAQVTLQRTEQEAQRLAQAILASARGYPTPWPTPSGTPLDSVIDTLRSIGAMRPDEDVAAAWEGGPAPQSSPQSSPQSRPLSRPTGAPLFQRTGAPQPLARSSYGPAPTTGGPAVAADASVPPLGGLHQGRGNTQAMPGHRP